VKKIGNVKTGARRGHKTSKHEKRQRQTKTNPEDGEKIADKEDGDKD